MLTATITDPKNTLSTLPTGSVAFYDGTALLGTVAVVDDQTATTATATLTATTINSVGSHSLSAVYTGDSNYASSQGTLAVAIATTATLTAKLSDSTVLPGSSTTLIATLTAASGQPTGSISAILNGNTYSGTFTTTASVATVNIPLTAPAAAGTYPITVSCVSSFVTCTPPPPISLVVQESTLIGTSTALTAGSTTPTSGAADLLTATINQQSAGAAAPSGTVVFYDGTNQLATSAVTNGVATASVTFTGAVAHSLTAVYSGDTLYAPSTSAVLSVTDQIAPDYSVALASSSLSLNSGATGQVTATLAMGFPGTVAFSCVPASGVSITCTFNPASLTASGSTTLTVTAAASSAQLSSPAVFPQRRLLAGGFSLAAVCCFLPLRRRQRRISLLAALLLLSVGLNVGCGGNTSSSSSTSTPQTSTLTIHTVGTEGTNTVAHDYPVQLTIQ